MSRVGALVPSGWRSIDSSISGRRRCPRSCAGQHQMNARRALHAASTEADREARVGEQASAGT